jgi:hypothetical protein
MYVNSLQQSKNHESSAYLNILNCWGIQFECLPGVHSIHLGAGIISKLTDAPKKTIFVHLWTKTKKR